MTSAISQPPLNVQLISMQPPEGIDTVLLALQGVETVQILPSDVLLYPGEYAELVVRVENKTDRSLQLKVEVDGELIAPCCYWQIVELTAKQADEVRLGFRAPIDFLSGKDR